MRLGCKVPPGHVPIYFYVSHLIMTNNRIGIICGVVVGAPAGYIHFSSVIGLSWNYSLSGIPPGILIFTIATLLLLGIRDSNKAASIYEEKYRCKISEVDNYAAENYPKENWVGRGHVVHDDNDVVIILKCSSGRMPFKQTWFKWEQSRIELVEYNNLPQKLKLKISKEPPRR